MKGIIQIAAPSLIGSGFYLEDEALLVTNASLVQGCNEVAVGGETWDPERSKVLLLDSINNVAFLAVPEGMPKEGLKMGHWAGLKKGDPVQLWAQAPWMELTSKKGFIIEPATEFMGVPCMNMDFLVDPQDSGSPLLDANGDVLGVNTWMARLPVGKGWALHGKRLQELLGAYRGHAGECASRCLQCLNLVFESTRDGYFCPHCNGRITLPCDMPDYEPHGVAGVIEEMIENLGYDVHRCRQGPNHWSWRSGSARVRLVYVPHDGYLTGDAYLCKMPVNNREKTMSFLLNENHSLEGIRFSLFGEYIVLSLNIYDRYLHPQTGVELLKVLEEKADYYDDRLLEEFGAVPSLHFGFLSNKSHNLSEIFQRPEIGT